MTTRHFDVVVVGAGNAGLVAALAASEVGARVLVLEAAGKSERGGNSRFSGGIFRFVHDGLESLRPLLGGSSDRWLDRVKVAGYGRDRYINDWMATSAGRPPRALVEAVVDRSRGTVDWMHSKGVAWELTADKLWDPSKVSASKAVDLPPGGAVRAAGEGVGLVDRLFAAVDAAGIETWYDAPAEGLIGSGAAVEGVRVRRVAAFDGVRGNVVLARGGFESNPELRLRYLGRGWDLVKVRGTRFNMGTMLIQALNAGAQPAGHWGGAHASPIDADAPAVGDLRLTDKMSRYSYPYALLVNVDGDRFVDEGEDQVWLTYAKTGWAIQDQPRGKAFQIFDQSTIHLLEPRYRTSTAVQSDTVEGLASQLGISPTRLVQTVRTFNHATPAAAATRFDPLTNDGLIAEPIGQPRKSNWSRPIDRGPFVAYAVTCGITFTYGGLKIDSSAQVIDTEGRPMPGLYAAGEIVGDFFYHNYAGGAGLMRGAVFGRFAGSNAARARLDSPEAAATSPLRAGSAVESAGD